jgi:hypothetical protein
MVYCHFIEASNQAEQSDSAAWLQFKCALKPTREFLYKFHLEKRSRFSIPWPIPPVPCHVEVYCGVLEEGYKAGQTNLAHQSPFGYG